MFLITIVWLYLIFVVHIVFIIYLYFFSVNVIAFGDGVDLFTDGDPFVDIFDEKRIFFGLEMLHVIFAGTEPPFRLFELSEAL